MENKIIQLIQKDDVRMQALVALQRLNLPSAYIAAGFVRNLVWDELHQYQPRTALNDVDVIYFAPTENPLQEKIHKQKLQTLIPQLNWQVKNQAYMHLKHQHPPYQSVLEAMQYWPEQETAIAVKINEQQALELISIFGLNAIFEGYISNNSIVPNIVFEQRLNEKQWLIHWPKLKIR